MRPALILLLLAGACSEKAPPPAPTKESAAPQASAARGLLTSWRGTQAPAVPFETGPDGKTETVADLLRAHPGRPLLLNLWATWCAPCIRELPGLDRLAADLAGRVTVVALSQDMEGWRKVSPFVAERNIPHLVVRLDSKMRFGLEAKAAGLPLTILYDPEGREVWRYAGDRDWTSAESRRLVGGG
jgi:thiol-disulfide isomerase/thioredoxin